MKENLKGEILEATIQVFNKKGMKFTMDDIAKQLSISKKTIYTVFKDKKSLMSEMVDYCFDSIKESEKDVLESDLETLEKIRKVLGVLPAGYKDIDFTQLYSLKEKFPDIYARVEERLESGWEPTIELIEQGKKEGVIRDIPTSLIKVMLESTLESFFKRDVLIIHHLSYQQALSDVVDIIIQGIGV